jgi:two-component system, chemotaxis family, chemotaxis protein CheY
MKLLIVEDNKNMRELFKTIFKKKFDEFIECEDGRKALNKYKESKPDWVFMDIKMKNMDGISATREIKDTFNDAKIIIVTDYGDEHLRNEAAQAGAYCYVLKENLQEIFNIII